MKTYNIEYSWIHDKQISLIVSSVINNGEELIVLCDELYDEYTKTHKEMSFYFFRNRENAVDYVYMRFVLVNFAEVAIENSHCIGHLENHELIGRFSPPKLLKVYDSPCHKNDIFSTFALQ